MTTKKKITVICLVVALVAALVVGTTLAYFTDDDSAKNTFTVGNVEIKLDEAPLKSGEAGFDPLTNHYIKDSDADRVQAVTYTAITPGAKIDKDPKVTNKGSEKAYARVDIIVSKAALTAFGCGKSYAKFPTILTGGDVMSTDARTWSTKEDNGIDDGFIDKNYLLSFRDYDDENVVFTVYILNKMATDDAVTIFDTINVPTDATLESLAPNGFTMDVKAYAIQAKGFATKEAAFAQLATEYPIEAPAE